MRADTTISVSKKVKKQFNIMKATHDKKTNDDFIVYLMMVHDEKNKK